MRKLESGQKDNLLMALARWNDLPDKARLKRLGIHEDSGFKGDAPGWSPARARKRLPFFLPEGYKLYEDGSVARKDHAPGKKYKFNTRKPSKYI